MLKFFNIKQIFSCWVLISLLIDLITKCVTIEQADTEYMNTIKVPQQNFIHGNLLESIYFYTLHLLTIFSWFTPAFSGEWETKMSEYEPDYTYMFLTKYKIREVSNHLFIIKDLL